ncbi:MAG: hypothetical protein N3F66_03195 [Spirochaetes bacterium]|nr:hypothetical protein [Spirochaetota bacterium]
MPDTTQYDSFSDQTQLINKALKYTNGNLEKARQMAAGILQDVAVIKGRFRSTKVGAFYVFLNVEYSYIININAFVTSYTDIYNKIRIFDAWKQFYNVFGDIVSDLGGATEDSYKFTNHLAEAIEGYDVYEPAKFGNIQVVSELFKEIIGKYFNQDTECQIEIDKTSSLTLEIENIPMELPGKQEEKEQELSQDEIKMREVESQVEYVIPGSVIVSPVKGKYINDIKPGEKISVMLSGKDPVSDKIARMFNAITSDGQYLPVRARIKEKIPLSTGGYAIYAVVAKNVLVKIIEEENVKIETDKQEQKKEDGNENILFVYIALLLGLIIISGIIVFALL